MSTMVTSWPWSERCREAGQPQKPSPPRIAIFTSTPNAGCRGTEHGEPRSGCAGGHRGWLPCGSKGRLEPIQPTGPRGPVGRVDLRRFDGWWGGRPGSMRGRTAAIGRRPRGRLDPFIRSSCRCGE
ncbi:hypothetical protein ACFFX0_17405 [Citricoccus parietis]|uniref:Uncharacterized protein n=1 Tax=Citricoccus parietis TaxID=592307 RepID=A0ABV5G1S1_9MICC